MRRIVAFVGSRDLDVRYRREVERVVVYEVGSGSEIWTGDCRTGVDSWVREFAAMLGATLRVFSPDPDEAKRYGYRAALAMRAERIADELEAERRKGADATVRAWSRPTPDGRPTAGTARTVDRARRHGLATDVRFRGEPRDG